MSIFKCRALLLSNNDDYIISRHDADAYVMEYSVDQVDVASATAIDASADTRNARRLSHADMLRAPRCAFISRQPAASISWLRRLFQGQGLLPKVSGVAPMTRLPWDDIDGTSAAPRTYQ